MSAPIGIRCSSRARRCGSSGNQSMPEDGGRRAGHHDPLGPHGAPVGAYVDVARALADRAHGGVEGDPVTELPGEPERARSWDPPTKRLSWAASRLPEDRSKVPTLFSLPEAAMYQTRKSREKSRPSLPNAAWV